MRPAGPGAHPPNAPRALQVTLRDGFRGHTVVIVVDGHEAYRRTGVTTEKATGRADAIELAIASRTTHIAVSVTPGDYVASLDLDVVRHPQLAISLVGEGTVSLETLGPPFRFT